MQCFPYKRVTASLVKLLFLKYQDDSVNFYQSVQLGADELATTRNAWRNS
jgi:hypothetical protein